MTKTLLEINSLAFGFSGAKLFSNLSLNLNHGDKVAIMGANGIGKTSLLRLIIGMYKPLHGTIKYQGTAVEQHRAREFGKAVSYIPQSVDAYPDLIAEEFFENVISPAADQIIQLLELRALLSRPYKSLSGGEQQRVLLASALSRQPQIILADELTQGVDKDFCLRFGECIKQYIETHNACLLAITHDYDWAKKYCTRCFLLENGELVSKYE